jgi:hypothetical protein
MPHCTSHGDEGIFEMHESINDVRWGIFEVQKGICDGYWAFLKFPLPGRPNPLILL